MASEELIVGLDLGGTKLAAALFARRDGGAIEFLRALEDIHYDGIFGNGGRKLSAEAKSELIADAMGRAAAELTAGKGRPAAVGVASAGFVERGFIVEAWNTGMKNFPLRSEVEKRTGAPAFLFKDSWAPAFAVNPDQPAIIFSIGTGFGGVSCEPGPSIKILSYSARKRILWIPMLFCNDDPGYAISFSVEQSAEMIKRGVEKAAAAGARISSEPGERDFEKWAAALRDAAKARKRLSPSWLELSVAKSLAREAAGRIRPGEVFADVPGAAIMPGIAFYWLTGEELPPEKIDAMLKAGDPAARTAFFIQAEFIGHILFRMQKERLEFRLPRARLVFGTGSGYNAATHDALSRPVIESMSRQCEENDVPCSGVEDVRLLCKPDGAATTLSCYGAARGAALGVAMD